MAIYSLNHRPIGKTTQSRPYTASSHVSYVTRRNAKPQVTAARMPADKTGAMAFFRQAEDSSRANARIGDKLMLALPRELSPEQRAALVEGFAEDVTLGRAPWFAAFHDNTPDAHNPHCHLLIRDRCPTTGKRVFGTSEAGSTERLRALWERHANQALSRAARSERIDRRTLEAQGIRRKAPVHEGPRSQAARRRGHRPPSRPVNARNGRGARSRMRRVDYPSIDAGRTRGEHNRALAASGESERDYWNAIEADRQARELDVLRAIHRPPELVEVRPLFGQPASAQILPVSLPASDAVSRGSLPHRRGDVPLSSTLLNGSDAVDKPAAQEKPFRTAPQERPDLLGKPLEPVEKSANHGDTVSNNAGDGKDPQMEDADAVLRKHRNNETDATFRNDLAQTKLDGLMKRSFLDPEAAKQRMDRYGDRYGRTRLYDMLRDRFDNNKHVHSRRPGSLFSRDGYEPGAAGRRNDADVARRGLPDALKQADESKAALERAREATKGAERRYGRGDEGAPGGASGPGGTTPGKKAVGRDGIGPARPDEPGRHPPSLSATPQQQVGGPPQHRPPTFSQASRGNPKEPVALRKPGEQDPPALRQGWKPKGATPQEAAQPPGKRQGWQPDKQVSGANREPGDRRQGWKPQEPVKQPSPVDAMPQAKPVKALEQAKPGKSPASPSLQPKVPEKPRGKDLARNRDRERGD